MREIERVCKRERVPEGRRVKATVIAAQATAQHRTAQRSTAQHSKAQHSTAQHSTAHYSTLQHITAHYSTLQHTTPHHTTPHHHNREKLYHPLTWYPPALTEPYCGTPPVSSTVVSCTVTTTENSPVAYPSTQTLTQQCPHAARAVSGMMIDSG